MEKTKKRLSILLSFIFGIVFLFSGMFFFTACGAKEVEEVLSFSDGILPKVYYLNEPLIDYEGLEVRYKKDGVERFFDFEVSMVRGFDSSTYGSKTMTVTCNGETINYKYTVLNLAGREMEVYEYRMEGQNERSAYPSTFKMYFEKDGSYSGRLIQGNRVAPQSFSGDYSINQRGNITLKNTRETLNKQDDGTYMLLGNSEGVRYELYLRLVDPYTANEEEEEETVEATYSYSIEGLDNVYYLDEGLNLSEAYVKVECSDPNVDDEMIAIDEDMISGFDSSTKGQKTLTINYEDEEIEFNYEVLDLEGLALEVFEYKYSNTRQFGDSSYIVPSGYRTTYEFSKDKTVLAKSYNNGEVTRTIRARFEVAEDGDINVYTGSAVETLIKATDNIYSYTTYIFVTYSGGQYIQARLKYKN